MTGKLKINPTNRLALYAKCVDSSCGSALRYQWTLYRRGLNGAWLPVEKGCDNYVAGQLNAVGLVYMCYNISLTEYNNNIFV